MCCDVLKKNRVVKNVSDTYPTHAEAELVPKLEKTIYVIKTKLNVIEK